MPFSASPSIDDLLSQLQGGMSGSSGPPPAPMSAENMNGPSGPPPGLLGGGGGGGSAPQPSMVDRVMSRMGGLLHDAGRGISDVMTGGTPAAAQAGIKSGLLTQDEVDAARPGLLHSLLVGPIKSENDYNTNVNNVLGMHQMAVGVSENQRAIQSRQNMQNVLGPMPGAGSTQDQQDTWVLNALGYAASNGDETTVKALEPVAAAAARRQRIAKPEALMQRANVQSDGTYDSKNIPAGTTVDQLLDPSTGKVIKETPVGAVPMSADAKAQHADTMAATAAARAATEGLRTDAQDNTQARSFNSTNAPLIAKGPKYNNFFNLLKEVQNGNEGSIEALKYATVQAIDTNAQMRQGILDRLERVRQSLAGTTGTAASLKLQGQLPQSVLADMERMVRSAQGADKALYKQHYDYAARINPRLGNHPDIMPPDVAFDIPGDAGAAVNSGVAKVKGFLPARP